MNREQRGRFILGVAMLVIGYTALIVVAIAWSVFK